MKEGCCSDEMWKAEESGDGCLLYLANTQGWVEDTSATQILLML